MKFELLILIGTAFFIMDIYHDGIYSKQLKSWKKYYQMAFFGFLGLSLYLFIKKYPGHSKSLFKHANDLVKYMPIDKDSTDLISPLLDFSSHFSGQDDVTDTPQFKRMMNSGTGGGIGTGGSGTGGGSVAGGRSKRCVSETKKKFVAANQNWKCTHCTKQLPAWFEVDHKIRLEHGGDNHVNNLEALCRDCHGKKTSMESMI